MILQALKAKLRQRGALGFAGDAAELSIACVMIGLESLAIAGAAATVAVAAIVSSPALALDLLTHPRAEDAGERSSCRNAEEPRS